MWWKEKRQGQGQGQGQGLLNRPIHIRHARDADLPFIKNSWLESHRDQSCAGMIPKSRYLKSIYPHMLRHLRNADVLVASCIDDHWQIFGYIIATKNVVYWLYVKYPFRRLGIATELMKHALPGWKHDYEINYRAAMWSKCAPYVARGYLYQHIMYDEKLLEGITQ